MALPKEQELRLRAAARRRRAESQQSSPQASGDPLGLDNGGQEQGRSAFDDFARGVGSGVANLAGIPIGAGLEAANLMGADVENTSGSDWLRSKLAPLGLTHEVGEDSSGSLPGAVGSAVGNYAVPGVGLTGALARRGAPLITGAARAPAATTGGRIVDEMAKGAARAPGATAGLEVTAAAGEATGRELGNESFGEDSWQKEVSALTGGILGGLAPSGMAGTVRRAGNFATDNLPVAGAVSNAVKRLFKLEPSASVKRRAGNRLRTVAAQANNEGDQLPAQANLRNPQDVDADLLTPAQQTNDPGIMSLAARERLDDPEIMANWRSQFEDNMNELRNRLKNVTGNEVADIEAELGQNVDDAVEVALGNANRRLGDMTPNQRRADASKVVRGELDRAYRSARQQESELWNSVPDDMVMPAETVRQRYQQLRGQLTEENIENMPDKARQFLDPDSPQSYFEVDADGELLTDTVPLKRLQALRSSLLDEARNLRSGSNPNRGKARLASELADGLLDDMDNLAPGRSEGQDAYNAARGFSRHLNDRFTRGTVADVLQTRGRGDSTITPESALDATVGRGGVRAQTASRDFRQALQSPSEEVRGAFTDYLKDDFRRMAMRDGQFNQAGGQRFMEKYRELLADQPQLAQQFQGAMESGNLANVAGSVQDGAARVLGKNNPASEVRRIKQQTQGDETGAVWASFRKGMTQELFERSRVMNPQGDIDTEILSGRRLLDALDGEKTGPALRQAYSSTEIANLRRIANTALRMERDIGARAAPDLVTDQPSMLSNLLAGYSGAIGGAKASSAIGGGAAGLRTAQLASSAMQKLVRRGIQDPSARLLHSALNDKQVMDDLMTPITNEREASKVLPRINAWLTGFIDSEDGEEDDTSPGPAPQRESRIPTIEIRRGQGQGPQQLPDAVRGILN